MDARSKTIDIIVSSIALIMFFVWIFIFFQTNIETDQNVGEYKYRLLKNKMEFLKESAKISLNAIESSRQKNIANTTQEIKKESLELIKNLKLTKNGGGRIWIIDTNSKMIMHPLNPQMNEKSFFDYKNAQGQCLFEDIIDIVNEKDSDFIRHKWSEADFGAKGDHISYISFFKSWGWIVGASFSLDKINTSIKEYKEKLDKEAFQKLIKYAVFCLVLSFVFIVLTIWAVNRVFAGKSISLRTNSFPEKDKFLLKRSKKIEKDILETKYLIEGAHENLQAIESSADSVLDKFQEVTNSIFETKEGTLIDKDGLSELSKTADKSAELELLLFERLEHLSSYAVDLKKEISCEDDDLKSCDYINIIAESIFEISKQMEECVGNIQKINESIKTAFASAQESDLLLDNTSKDMQETFKECKNMTKSIKNIRYKVENIDSISEKNLKNIDCVISKIEDEDALSKRSKQYDNKQ